MPVNLPTAFQSNSNQLEISIRRIFDQAQTSNANHRKNYVALYKLHTEFAAHREFLNKGRSMKLTGERYFERLFHHLVLCILPIKKGVTSADRIVKFVAGYIKFINEKALEANSNESDDDEDGTTASRFTAKLLKFLLTGFSAKNKNVRYRVLQIVAEMISYLGQIDEDIYKTLRAALIDRLDDRESTIRSLAVTSLAKLSASEDPEDLSGKPPILQTLLGVMSKDDSADVRRTVVLTIPINTETLPGVLDRMQDVDPTIRKVIYAKALVRKVAAEEPDEDSDVIGPTHPQELTKLQREQIVQSGLADRDPSVRSAAAELIASWIDTVNIEDEDRGVKVEEDLEEKPETALLSFLGLFDLQEGSIAKEALSSIFESREKTFNNIDFDDNYWVDLTPEKAFLARVFVEYCKANKDDIRLEATMPVVTLIAFRIQEAYNMLDDILSSSSVNGGLDDHARKATAYEKLPREIVISELLRLAVHLDYSDEIGRRKTLQLVRGMLRSESLPESLIAPCLDVLRTLSSTEGELIRLVVEAIQELREATYGEDESEIPTEDISAETSLEELRQNATSTKNQDMSPEQKLVADEVDLKCLLMCVGVLVRVNGTLEKNITLEAVLNDLIIPSVQREEQLFKERGIKALGLCCLIAKPLALRSIGFFINKVSSSIPAVKVALLHSVFDIFMVYEAAMLKDNEITLEAVTSFLITNILEEPDPSVKAVLCEGTAKLIFSGFITSIEALQTLIKAYFSPLTAGNHKLRQCLAVFFPTYSRSSHENQKRMADIFIHVFLDVSEDRKNARDADRDVEVIGSSQVAAMFADWTDPLSLSHDLKAAGGIPEEKAVNHCIQLEMAEDILRVLFEKDLKIDIEKDDKKVLCQLLNKLHVPDVADDYRIRSLKLLMDTLKMRRPLRDSASKTAFIKFESTIVEKFEKQLEGFSEAEYRKLEELNELFEFLDSVVPLDDEYVDVDVPRKGRKRRSESVSTTTESHSCSPLPCKDRVKHKSKRARLSTPDEDFKDQEDGDRMPRRSTTAPRRTLPKRAAAAKKPQEVIVITSDSDEERESEPAKRAGAQSSTSEEEAEIDKQMDKLLISNASSSNMSEAPYDSIMDTDSEEEEEVNDLLVAD